MIITVHGPAPAGHRPAVLRTSAAPSALLSEAVGAVPASQVRSKIRACLARVNTASQNLISYRPRIVTLLFQKPLALFSAFEYNVEVDSGLAPHANAGLAQSVERRIRNA